MKEKKDNALRLRKIENTDSAAVNFKDRPK